MPLKENKRFQGYFAEGLAPGGRKVYLLKPLTYMNRSGQSVRAVIDWYKVEPQSVLVIYDDWPLCMDSVCAYRDWLEGITE